MEQSYKDGVGVANLHEHKCEPESNCGMESDQDSRDSV